MKKSLFLLMLLLCCLPLSAHQFSTAYLDLQLQQNTVQGSWKVTIHDLAQAGVIKGDVQQQISWQQLLDSSAEVVAYIQQRLLFTDSSSDCPLQTSAKADWMLQNLQQEFYLIVPFSVECRQYKQPKLHYQALFDAVPTHKLLLQWQSVDGQRRAVLTQQQQGFSFNFVH